MLLQFNPRNKPIKERPLYVHPAKVIDVTGKVSNRQYWFNLATISNEIARRQELSFSWDILILAATRERNSASSYRAARVVIAHVLAGDMGLKEKLSKLDDKELARLCSRAKVDTPSRKSRPDRSAL